MKHDYKLSESIFQMRPIDNDDAEFTLMLRNDNKLNSKSQLKYFLNSDIY